MESTSFVYGARDRRGCIPVRWDLHERSDVELPEDATSFQTLDVYILPEQQVYFPAHGRPHIVASDSPIVRVDEARLVVDGIAQDKLLPIDALNAFEFLVNAATVPLHASPGAIGNVPFVAVKFIIPSKGGYVVRGDFLELRMEFCPDVTYVAGFTKADEFKAGRHDAAINGHASPRIESLLSLAVGGICVHSESQTGARLLLDRLEPQLINRLSFPWLVPNPPRQRTLVLVEGRKHPTSSGGGEGVWRAVHALGIRLVVIDDHGHWMQDPSNAHLRHTFLAVDMTIDDGLPERIVKVLERWGGHVDGVLTFLDGYILPVAKVAEILGLATPPVDGVAVAVDKYKTRSLQATPDDPCMFFNSLQDYRHLKMSGDVPLTFPMIVKPPHGSSSEGAYRAANIEELDTVVELVFEPYIMHKYGPGAVLERYESGPEVDINLVLLNDQILFSEVNDDFPSPADFDTGIDVTFADTGNVLPSRLPRSEQDMLITSAHQYLRKLRFHTGIFHIEARVRNSSMRYNSLDGMLDLRAVPSRDTSKPASMFLIEINARQPGYRASSVSGPLYGLDYYALRILLAMGEGEGERIRALSMPFRSNAQGHSHILMWWSDYGGIFKSGDVFGDLRKRRPDISARLKRTRCFPQRGDVVPDPRKGALAFLAYGIVFSDVGREDVMYWARELRKEVEFVVEPLSPH